MAQHSHVPKFGNWETDNIPYTTYFENARKEKASVRMNPNDPEQNPDAFMWAKGDQENYDTDGLSSKTPLHLKSMSSEKHCLAEGHIRHTAQHRDAFDHQKSRGHRRAPSESGSDMSNSDYSDVQSGHRSSKSDRKKSMAEGSISFSPSAVSVSGHSGQKSGSRPPSDSQRHKAASVPKFGAWDETDPKSGEGFTVIFEKVKEEKQIASAKFPTPSPQPSSYSNSQIKYRSSSIGSKMCCCLFSSAKE